MDFWGVVKLSRIQPASVIYGYIVVYPNSLEQWASRTAQDAHKCVAYGFLAVLFQYWPR